MRRKEEIVEVAQEREGEVPRNVQEWLKTDINMLINIYIIMPLLTDVTVKINLQW